MTTAADVTLRGRELAESLMVDACTITHPATGVGSYGDGEYTPPAETPVYDGPCQVQVTDSLDGNTPEVGGRLATLQRVVVKLPVSATGVAVDDIVNVTASQLDDELVVKRYRVVATHAKTYATARRLQCEEVTG